MFNINKIIKILLTGIFSSICGFILIIFFRITDIYISRLAIEILLLLLLPFICILIVMVMEAYKSNEIYKMVIYNDVSEIKRYIENNYSKMNHLEIKVIEKMKAIMANYYLKYIFNENDEISEIITSLGDHFEAFDYAFSDFDEIKSASFKSSPEGIRYLFFLSCLDSSLLNYSQIKGISFFENFIEYLLQVDQETTEKVGQKRAIDMILSLPFITKELVNNSGLLIEKNAKLLNKKLAEEIEKKITMIAYQLNITQETAERVAAEFSSTIYLRDSIDYEMFEEDNKFIFI